MHGGTLSHPPRVLASREVEKIGVRAFRSMRKVTISRHCGCSSGVRSTARATYRQEASAVLKAAPNTPKAPHCELVKVRIRAGRKQTEGSIHLGTESDASPGGGGCQERPHVSAVSDSFSCALARRDRRENANAGRSWHPERACSVRVLPGNGNSENGEGRQRVCRRVSKKKR